MTPDQFIAFTTEIPYSPRAQNATGLLAPLVRSMGHLLYLGAILSKAKADGVIYEEAYTELGFAKDHLPQTIFINDSPVLSQTAKIYINTYIASVCDLEEYWNEWDEDARLRCIIATVNAVAALAAYLDQELAGFLPNQSDPGTLL
jgi:hypothetical protein